MERPGAVGELFSTVDCEDVHVSCVSRLVQVKGPLDFFVSVSQPEFYYQLRYEFTDNNYVWRDYSVFVLQIQHHRPQLCD